MAVTANGAANRPGLLVSALSVIPYLVFAAACIVAVEWVLSYFEGSYISGEIVFTAFWVWTAVAVVTGVILAIALLPLLLVIKGPWRSAIMPAIAVTIGYAAAALNMLGNLHEANAYGGALLMRPEFLASWGVVLGALTGVVAAKTAGRRWPIVFFAIASMLFTTGITFYVHEKFVGYTLAIAPIALVSLGGALMGKFARLRAAWVVALATVVFGAALYVTAYAKGTPPLKPIDDHYKPDAGAAAMLAGKPNVIIIVMDTVRADHTSLCGYKYTTTPNLEKLAADCRFFPRGETVDSWTLPAHASMFTGLYPREHGAHGAPEQSRRGIERYQPYGIPLAPSRKTLAWYLAAKGYNTGAIMANYTWLCRQFGLNQGFHYYYDVPRMLPFMKNYSVVFKWPLEAVDRAMGLNGKLLQTYWSAQSITKMAQSWVDRSKEAPFFLFVNYMDAHYPYAAVPPFDHIDGPGIPYNSVCRLRPFQDLITQYIKTGKGLNDELLREIVNQYDGEIAYTDHWIGKFIDQLKAEGLYDEALIIVTSDHGEFLGEHRLLNHGVGIYEGGMQIPILVKYPRQQFAGEVRKERVSIVDIFATVLDVAKLPLPPVTATPLGGKGHIIIAEEYENGQNVKYYGSRFKGTKTATYEDDLKYMTRTGGEKELYDLGNDAAELTNLAASDVNISGRMDGHIVEWLNATKLFDGAAEAKKPMTDEDKRRLKSLGYIGG
jgi:arylsulfatase A-like enzyme